MECRRCNFCSAGRPATKVARSCRFRTARGRSQRKLVSRSSTNGTYRLAKSILVTRFATFLEWGRCRVPLSISGWSTVPSRRGPIQIDYVEIATPVYDEWPPASHNQIFFPSENQTDESNYSREVLLAFMKRAWRRPIADRELVQKLRLFENMRSQCDTFEEAMVEVLATILASPQFLYLSQPADDGSRRHESTPPNHELATRLSMFLWCSVPDQELQTLASSGGLSEPQELRRQVDRMLGDPRARRLSERFVHQWLDMQLLDFLSMKRGHESLKEAMQQEPVELFDEMLRTDASVLDFVHSDYTMMNERLAAHYGLSDVKGNHFRRVDLRPEHRRGGLLTQSGLLAMNSAGGDSHPLKRGVWLLESLLNDPPPPPPPAVPEIDLADPEIAKMTLKERIEDHRNHAACRSCHAKIDPWGIAFENYDALGALAHEGQRKTGRCNERSVQQAEA